MKHYFTKRNIILVFIIIAALGLEFYEWHAIRNKDVITQSDDKVQKSIEALSDQNSQIMLENTQLKAANKKSEKSLKELQDQVAALTAKLDTTMQSEIELLVDKLKDKNYTSTYNEDYTWYTAAEALGAMGKPAIPYLIKKIDTKDAYEQSLVFYALTLASQADNVKEFAGNDYIKITDSFDASSAESSKKEILRWWEKYKDKF